MPGITETGTQFSTGVSYPVNYPGEGLSIWRFTSKLFKYSELIVYYFQTLLCRDTHLVVHLASDLFDNPAVQVRILLLTLFNAY